MGSARRDSRVSTLTTRPPWWLTRQTSRAARQCIWTEITENHHCASHDAAFQVVTLLAFELRIAGTLIYPEALWRRPRTSRLAAVMLVGWIRTNLRRRTAAERRLPQGKVERVAAARKRTG